MQNKNLTIITVDVEKTFDRIQHPFITETLNKVGMVGHGRT